jgi:osmotically-inducible protein OsmY
MLIVHGPEFTLTQKGTTMNKSDVTALAAAIALAISAGALGAQAMSKQEYKAGQDRIGADYKSAKAACDSLSANAKDVCMAEAKGKQKVAKAELEATNKPGDKASYAVSVAKAEANYAVAKEKCDDKSGNEKKACVKEAKAAETRAKTDAKAQMKTADASKPAKEKSATPASKKETAGKYIDDAVITAKVKEAVLEEPSLKSAEINVETSKGTVQLSGFVRSRTDINKAVEVTKGVKGVKSVKNDMILKGTQ